MKELPERRRSYADAGIWNFQSPRNSCMVPEKPLIISSEEERDLNEMALGVYEAIGVAVGIAKFSQEEPWYRYRDSAAPFPGGLTMPPAIRVDVVRTDKGPKIVEVDPITALSIGETAFLAREWAEDYEVIESPVRQIVNCIQATDARQLSINLPADKIDYLLEMKYLAAQLREAGVDTVIGEDDSPSTIQLSGFYEVPSARKRLTSSARTLGMNPLWGSLNGLSSKVALAQLLLLSERLNPFAVREYTPEELSSLPDDKVLIAKPVQGTGSIGLKALFPSEVKRAKGFVFQEALQPVIDNFGDVMSPDNKILQNTSWVTRLSVYAGRTGMVGAQVTARQPEKFFTNVDGKPDAIQAALAVDVTQD